MTEPRNLRLSHYPTPNMPDDPMQWTLGELEEWANSVRATGRSSPSWERAWSQMLTVYRTNEVELETVIRFGSRPPAPEVLAEVPRAWLAYRLYPRNTEAVLLSDALARRLTDPAAQTRRGTAHAGLELLQALLAYAARQEARLHGRHRGCRAAVTALFLGTGRGKSFTAKGIALLGGLRITIDRGQVDIRLETPGLRRAVATLPAHRALASTLRKLIAGWFRLIRHVIADRAVLTLPIVPRVGDATMLALRAKPGLSNIGPAAFVDDRGLLCVKDRQIVGLPHTYDDWDARYAFAGTLMRALARQHGFVDPQVERSIETVLADVFSAIPCLASIDPPRRGRHELLASLDGPARKHLVALQGGQPVPLDAPAEAYEIRFQHHYDAKPFAQVRELVTAVDLERCNRPG